MPTNISARDWAQSQVDMPLSERDRTRGDQLIGREVYVRFAGFINSPYIKRTVRSRPAIGLIEFDRPMNELLVEAAESPPSAVYRQDELDIRLGDRQF